MFQLNLFPDDIEEWCDNDSFALEDKVQTVYDNNLTQFETASVLMAVLTMLNLKLTRNDRGLLITHMDA